jgi:hypothetical protein
MNTIRRMAAGAVLAVLGVAGSAPAIAAADNYLTQSGRVLCAVTPDASIDGFGPDVVVCQGEFAQAPEVGAGVVTTGDGTLFWQVGNLAVDNPTTQMSYGQTYHRGNWTIRHDADGTRFTNDLTGHGMFVSIENVSAF